MKDKRGHYLRHMQAIDRLQAVGLLTDGEARKAVGRLLKNLAKEGWTLERTGFREYAVVDLDPCHVDYKV